MNVKKVALQSALLASVCLTSFAGGFNGPFVQAGVGQIQTKTTGSGISNSYVPDADGTASSRDWNGLLTAGLSRSSGDFNLAANVFYVMDHQRGGEKFDETSPLGVDHTITTSNQQKNTFGIAIEPGLNITDKTLAYLKFAWVMSQHHAWVTSTGIGSNSSNHYAANLNGFGYGVGLKQLVGDNLYLGLDIMAVNYENHCHDGDGVCFRPSQVLGFVTVGYNFSF